MGNSHDNNQIQSYLGKYLKDLFTNKSSQIKKNLVLFRPNSLILRNNPVHLILGQI